MNTIEVTLTKEKETKNSIRFTEGGDEPKIGTLYIPKATLRGMDNADGSKPVKVKLSM